MDRLKQIGDCINQENGDSLKLIFEEYLIDPHIRDVPIEKVNENALFNEFSNDTKAILNAIITLNRSVKTYEVVANFEAYLKFFTILNRFAEQQTNWFLKGLIVITKLLINSARTADLYIENNPQLFENNKDLNDLNIETESCLIKSSRVINNSFKLCLNDKNEDLYKNRRSQVYFFVNQELRIFFNLQNIELAKNMEKVLISKKNDLPKLNSISKSQSISYLYYSGAIACGDGDFKNAYQKFKNAYELCLSTDKKHLELILVYLIPLKFLITKKYPNLAYLKQNFENLYTLYFDLISSLQNGDLLRFENFFNDFESFFLKKNLYLVIENLRNFIILKLIKKIYSINNESSHLPISLVSKGIEFSNYHNSSNNFKFSNDESECLLANLIFKSFIKGYISHTNGVCVLSKKDPFPLQVLKNE